MNLNNIDKVKKHHFLSHEANNNEYHMMKSGKNILNLPKQQIQDTHHVSVNDYLILPKNNNSEYPFNGSSQFYIDFEIPKFDFTFYQFVLRFKLTNSATVDVQCLPPQLMIDRVSLLKNSQVVGYDVDGYDIFLYTLNKLATKYQSNKNIYSQCAMMMITDSNDKYISDTIQPGGYYNLNFEIPICLTNSNFLASCIKNELVIRIYFKGNITVNGSYNSFIKLHDISMAMRVKQISSEAIQHIKKQPKINHLFNKRIISKYNIPKLDAGSNYSVNLNGCPNIVSNALIFIQDTDSNILTTNKYWYTLNYNLDNMYISDGSGKNIFNSQIIYQKDYNRYICSEYLKKFYENILKIVNSTSNYGEIWYLPFNSSEKSTYEGHYSGGINLSDTSSDLKLNFKSTSTSSGNVVLYVIWSVPALLTLQDGDLTETL